MLRHVKASHSYRVCAGLCGLVVIEDIEMSARNSRTPAVVEFCNIDAADAHGPIVGEKYYALSLGGV